MVEMTFLQTKVKVIHIDTNRFFIYNLLLAVNSRLTFALEHSSRKRTKYGKKRKFEKRKKRRSNDIYAMHIVLKTTVTTLNQFCCLSQNGEAIIF